MEPFDESLLEDAPPSRPLPWKDLPRIHRGQGGYRAIDGRARPAFQLTAGRTIHLKTLHQFQTYGGVLCGLPTECLNQSHVDSAVRDAARLFHVSEDGVIVVPPVLLVSTVASGRSGTPVDAEIDFLPPVTSFGWFDSDPMDPECGGSGVAVVWFQDHFGAPQEWSLLQEIRKIDWESHARDWDW